MNFVHIDINIDRTVVNAPVLVSGYYHWHRAMGGPFLLFDEARHTIKDYDVIFVALTGYNNEAMLLRRIAEAKRPDATIIVTIDYAAQLWSQLFNPILLKYNLSFADGIIAPTKDIANALLALMPSESQTVFTTGLHHPCDIESLERLKTPYPYREKVVFTHIHQYEPLWMPAWLVAHGLIDYSFLGMTKDNQVIRLAEPYMNFVPVRAYPEYLKWAATKAVMVESYHCVNNYGRAAQENAVLGIPTIGSTNTELQKDLWPQLTTAPYDLTGQRDLLEAVISEPRFAMECIDAARSNVESCSYAASKENMTKFVESVRRNPKRNPLEAEITLPAQAPSIEV